MLYLSWESALNEKVAEATGKVSQAQRKDATKYLRRKVVDRP